MEMMKMETFTANRKLQSYFSKVSQSMHRKENTITLPHAKVTHVTVYNILCRLPRCHSSLFLQVLLSVYSL
jgi:hypothetical protein